LTNSFSNSEQTVNVSLGNICGKNITVNGCSADQFGDQFIELSSPSSAVMDHRVRYNDDINPWRICSRLEPAYADFAGCNETMLNLGCFGTSNCGGTVEVTIGECCAAGSFSKTGFTPCLPCPAGLTSYPGQSQCTLCADGYIGFNQTAPCVACPTGTIEYLHSSCEICNVETLDDMSDDLYDKCLLHLLNHIIALERKVDSLDAAFDQYLVDVKHGMPTFHPTAMPTRRRRSRAPVVSGHGL
jgi:hypothetical protein